MLNVNRLRMLREVSNRGTIAAAAEALFMSPSAVSQQMAVLEREADTPLLERQGRGVRLTPAGARLVENTERILAALEMAEADLAAASTGVVGTVRVSAFPTAARALLVPTLVALRDKHPNLEVSTFDFEPEQALPALHARELDVVVAYEWSILPALDDRGVERELLFTEPVFLALPRTHPLAVRSGPVSIAELRDEQWIMGRDSTSMLTLVTEATRQAGYVPRSGFHSMDGDVMLTAVGAGVGVALVPPLMLPSDYPNVRVKHLADLRLERRVRMTIRRGSGGTPGIRAVMEELREQSGAVRDLVSDIARRAEQD